MEKNVTEIGSELRITNHDVKVFVDRSVAASLPKYLTGIEGVLVNYIFEHEQITACDCMRDFNLSKATVSETFRKLIDRDFIQEITDEHDKRRKIITLTTKGKEAHFTFQRLYDSLVPIIEEGISEEEKETFLKVCVKIRKNVGGIYEQNQE